MTIGSILVWIVIGVLLVVGCLPGFGIIYLVIRDIIQNGFKNRKFGKSELRKSWKINRNVDVIISIEPTDNPELKNKHIQCKIPKN